MVVNPIYPATCKAIKDWTEQHGSSPSIRDLVKVLGISHQATYQRLLKLEEAGLIEWPARWGTGSYRGPYMIRLRRERDGKGMDGS